MRLHRMVIGAFSVFIAALFVNYLFLEEPKPDLSARSYSGDALITQSIEVKLSAFKETSQGVINVKTTDGSVLLSGFAKSDEEKSAAEGVAHKVIGVKSVKNELVVRP
jgi:hyperosmotically inducible periplasmic protein